MKAYDYLIVGAGLYGCVFAYKATQLGKSCLIVEKRNHIGGNCYTENIEDINVHIYGAHIFHTSNENVWKFVNQFANFNNYINSPIANYNGQKYNLPFNMNTFHQMWGVETQEEARTIIDQQRAEFSYITQPANLEEQALVLAGKDIYERLIKGYSEKQWGMKATEIPAFVIKRLPFRFTYNNNYFNDSYQGIPKGGYTQIFEKLVDKSEVLLNIDYLNDRGNLNQLAQNIVYTGPIDAYFNYCYGNLDYRSLMFEHKLMKDVRDFQGNAVVNYTSDNVPYTRTIEHKHFEFGNQPDTIVTYEYPLIWNKNEEPYYPINNDKNNALYSKYKMLAQQEKNVFFGGRLAEYKYYDMHQIVESVLSIEL